MSDVKMLVSALTDVGLARKTNEDAFAVTDLATGLAIEVIGNDHAIDVLDRGVLLALSDGMGGHQAGEVASALVLESLQAGMQDDDKGSIHTQLEEAVLRANRTVMTAAKESRRHGMGATLTAVFVRGMEAYIAEVGDSRAYLLRKGRLRQITRDQSLVQLLVDQGVLSAEEARNSPSKNVILQAVGLSEDVRVAIARLELRRGDRFLLCSDGVSNAIEDEELREILTGSDPRAACDTMIKLANERGGNDNQTAIVADLSGEGIEPPDEFETVTSTYEVLRAYEATMNGRPVTASEARTASDSLGARPAAPSNIEIEAEAEPEPAPSASSPEPVAGDTQQLRRAPRLDPMVMWIVVAGAVLLLAVLLALGVL